MQGQIKIYQDLAKNLGVIENSSPSGDGFKCNLHLGCEVFAKAKVYVTTTLSRALPTVVVSSYSCKATVRYLMSCGCYREDTSYVYVDVGLGFYPAMTFDEAREFCAKKEEILEQ